MKKRGARPDAYGRGMDNTAEVRDFLVTRRARITPEQRLATAMIADAANVPNRPSLPLAERFTPSPLTAAGCF